MQIVFYDVGDWEKEGYLHAFPKAKLVHESLSIRTVHYAQKATCVSGFIDSRISKEMLDAMPNLRYIAARSTGYDHIDLKEALRRNIIVSNVPDYGSRTVAEHTFGLILALTRKLFISIEQAKAYNFSHENIRGTDLFGKTIGIVGLGKIGTEVAKIADVFGMKILIHTQHPDTKLQKMLTDCTFVSLPYLLKHSDVVSLHVPLTPETHHLINLENIAYMNKNSYLINTSRGGLIDSQAILYGLQHLILAGVGLDVVEMEEELSHETHISHHKNHTHTLRKTMLDYHLINHPKVIYTPHNAFNSIEALERIAQTTIDNIRAMKKQKPIHVISL